MLELRCFDKRAFHAIFVGAEVVFIVFNLLGAGCRSHNLSMIMRNWMTKGGLFISI